MNNQSLIFDFKRYSINDGPGIRVTVFFKGCHLHCRWCHNPESIKPSVEKMYNSSKCIGVQECVKHCPNKALTLTKERGIVTEFNLCKLCGICADVCPTKAIEMSGRYLEIEEIMKMILRETITMDTSGGGVTFSGGEPTMHYDLLMALLLRCGDEGIHRVVDTSGFTTKEKLLSVAEHCELFLYDVKHMDDELHKKFTGASNKIILENLKTLAAYGSEIFIRIPLIEGVNADEKNIIATAQFVKSLDGKPKPVHLLPYHNIASKKYEKLGGQYNNDGMKEPTKERVQQCIEIFSSYGLEATVGG